ncbi:MAG: 3-dehydroquinate synthase [Acidobacteria bacterium]|nr:3-dehydroquinate synthase [Acidobacteriota bacterium]
MQRIPVRAASAAYEVIVEADCLEKAAEYLGPVVKNRRLFVVADERVWHAQGDRLRKGLADLPFELITAELGEQRKRLSTVEAMAERLHQAGADRSAVLAAFGGGVAGDMVGFLGAAYMRGVDVIQIPTTLLSQVDSAVGGKTGVNLAGGKNLFGAFLQPKLALIDTHALDTLPEREIRAGLYEVIKYGVIWSPELFDLLENKRDAVLAREAELIERIVAESVRIKAEVVAEDEREGGLRRILNYGHTFGHALEAETRYELLLHGEAVGWGMIAAGRLGEALGTISHEERLRIERVILAYGPIPSLEGVDAARTAPRVMGDKKTIGGKTNFILPERIGQVKVVSDVAMDAVEAAMQAALDAVAASS